MSLPLCAPYQEVEFCRKGETAVSLNAGDFILIKENTFISHLIQFGQGLRMRGITRKYNQFSHCALIIDSQGTIIEALTRGVRQSSIDKYHNTEYSLVRITASMEDRVEIINFAKSCLKDKYGWFSIASIILTLLTGAKFSFGLDGTEICSALVARALERTNAIFPENVTKIMPAQLANYYDVPLQRLSFIPEK